MATRPAERNLTQLLDDIGPAPARSPARIVVHRPPARHLEKAVVLDVGRLKLLGALREGSMGQLVWGSAGQSDRPTGLYSFERDTLTLHEILRDGSLDRIEVSVPLSCPGSRPWLTCPNLTKEGVCGHRAKKVYLISGESQLKCRFCVGRRRILRLTQLAEATSHALTGNPSQR